MGPVDKALANSVEDRLRCSELTIRANNDELVRGDPNPRVAIQAVNAAGGYAFLGSV